MLSYASRFRRNRGVIENFEYLDEFEEDFRKCWLYCVLYLLVDERFKNKFKNRLWKSRACVPLSGHLHKNLKEKKLNFVFLLQVFFVFAIFVFRETRFFRNLGSFAKLRNSQNSSLIFAKHENRFVASFAKFSRNEISSKTLIMTLCIFIYLKSARYLQGVCTSAHSATVWSTPQG